MEEEEQHEDKEKEEEKETSLSVQCSRVVLMGLSCPFLVNKLEEEEEEEEEIEEELTAVCFSRA